ncbi:MAG: hypothetical protein ACREQF_02230 [Candidatus Binataceae bacterium]
MTAKVIATALFMLLLSGCASAPVPIDPVPVVPGVSVVEVPVRERCRVEIPAEPLWLFTGIVADSLFDFYRRALAEIEQRREYEGRVRAAAAKCE